MITASFYNVARKPLRLNEFAIRNTPVTKFNRACRCAGWAFSHSYIGEMTQADKGVIARTQSMTFFGKNPCPFHNGTIEPFNGRSR